MYNKTKFILAVLAAVLIIFSCGKSDKTDTGTKEKTSQDSKEQTGQNSGNQNQQTGSTEKKDSDTKSANPELKWDFRPLKPGKYDEPMTDVYLNVNGKSQFVAKIYYAFSETPKSEFKSLKIPTEALTSCRGWWAGAGIDYWVIKKDNELIVYSKDIGETTNENGEPGDFEGKPVQVTTINLN